LYVVHVSCCSTKVLMYRYPGTGAVLSMFEGKFNTFTF
jgi:hypothetical protein